MNQPCFRQVKLKERDGGRMQDVSEGGKPDPKLEPRQARNAQKLEEKRKAARLESKSRGAYT